MPEYKPTTKSTSRMVKISLLSVISFVLMLAEFIVPAFPEFLKLDISDAPALIAAFSMGPVAGVMVEAIKNILHLLMTKTGGIGELANFIIGTAMVIPAGYIYRMKKNKSNAVIGLLIGTIFMGIAGALANYYILIPFYSTLFQIGAIIEMSAKANGAIHDLKTLILYAVVPFNVLKGLIVSVIVLMIYKRISIVLHK